MQRRLHAAVERKVPALRLHVQIVQRQLAARVVLAVARERAVDQPRISNMQCLVVDAELPCHSGTKALHHHIGAPCELEERRTGLLVFEVDRNGALIASERLDIVAHPVALRTLVPAEIAQSDILNLHDIGPEIRQHLRGVPSGKIPRQIKHAQSLKRRTAHETLSFPRRRLSLKR